MPTFSKFRDVQAVMDKANNSLPNIERQYLDCLHKEEIPDSLLVDIKDYLANLRSALDYLWHKIPNAPNSYFPVANSEADFIAKTKGIDGERVASLKGCQDYDPNSWIRAFNLFRNKNAHFTLTPQTRRETKEFSVKTPGSSDPIATFHGCTFGGNGNCISVMGTPMPIDLKTQFPVNTPGLDIERKIWVDFIFDHSSISPEFPQGVSALPFLKASLANVTKIIADIEKNL